MSAYLPYVCAASVVVSTAVYRNLRYHGPKQSRLKQAGVAVAAAFTWPAIGLMVALCTPLEAVACILDPERQKLTVFGVGPDKPEEDKKE